MYFSGTVKAIEMRPHPSGMTVLSAVIQNDHNQTLCPDIQVEGTVKLTFEGGTVDLTTGSYKVADIKLRQGDNVVGVSGAGAVTFTYREATL